MRTMQSRIMGGGVRRCPLCGTKQVIQGYTESSSLTYTMDWRGICCECAYWENLILYPPEGLQVLGEECLRILPLVMGKDHTMILGGKGKRRCFEIISSGKFITSNDIWRLGVIPERFRDRLKPTVVEITRESYSKLVRWPNKCFAKACLDRYLCWRYDLSIEKGKEPFNRIPANWNPGDEHCRFYIDKTKVYI